MRRRILMLLIVVSMMALGGCKRTPKTVGEMNDWSIYDDEDGYVCYAYNKYGFYSNGSFEAEMMLRSWLKNYRAE